MGFFLVLLFSFFLLPLLFFLLILSFSVFSISYFFRVEIIQCSWLTLKEIMNLLFIKMKYKNSLFLQALDIARLNTNVWGECICCYCIYFFCFSENLAIVKYLWFWFVLAKAQITTELHFEHIQLRIIFVATFPLPYWNFGNKIRFCFKNQLCFFLVPEWIFFLC